MRGPPRQHRLPLAPLLAAAHVGPGELAELVHRRRNTIYHYVHDGVPMFAADEFACRIGLHPASVWSEWFEIDTVPA